MRSIYGMCIAIRNEGHTVTFSNSVLPRNAELAKQWPIRTLKVLLKLGKITKRQTK
jgi:hypothetical protein